MQAVSSAFSAEETSSVRNIAQSVQVSWKKDYLSSITLFTIGVSTIGGNDIISGPAGVQSDWNRRKYVDESGNVLNISYERELSLPLGGLTKAMADVSFDNTSNRYTPWYAGGNSEIYTAVLPRRPFVINAGFEVNGVNQTIPQFIGVTDKTIEIDKRRATARLHGVDFIGFLQNRPVDKTAMFTSQRSDIIIGNLLNEAGFATAQYDLDEGINNIGFGLFNSGDKLGDVIDRISKAENAHFYQDEEGKLHFSNRQHWDIPPHTTVQRIISTSQVIQSKVPSTSRIINSVEIIASPREVMDYEPIWDLGFEGGTSIELPINDTEKFVNYDDPIFVVTTPVPNGTPGQSSYYVANTESDGSGSDVTSLVSIKSIDNFAQASKIIFTNNSGSTAYLTTLDVWGRPARKTGDILYRDKIGSSITAFEEQVLKIENNYIQDATWAESYATLILQDFATPERIQEITIRAIPELQMGDLISWQGMPWRVFGISGRLDPEEGFVQDLNIIQRDIRSYFRIGISTIGGSDTIAP